MTATTLSTAEAIHREYLTEVARDWDARSSLRYESLRQRTDHRLAPGHAGCVCGKCLVCLWAAFRWDLKRAGELEAEVASLAGLHEGLKDGREHWSNWREDLTCFNRQDAAIEESGAAVEDARAELAGMEMRVASGLDALTGGTR